MGSEFKRLYLGDFLKIALYFSAKNQTSNIYFPAFLLPPQNAVITMFFANWIFKNNNCCKKYTSVT